TKAVSPRSAGASAAAVAARPISATTMRDGNGSGENRYHPYRERGCRRGHRDRVQLGGPTRAPSAHPGRHAGAGVPGRVRGGANGGGGPTAAGGPRRG